MISKYTYKKLTWIDVQKPSKEEINRLQEDYKIPQIVCEELLSPTVRSKVEVHNHLLFITMHFPTKNPTLSQTLNQEVDFIIGSNMIITVHYEPVNALTIFSKQFNVGSQLEQGKEIPHAGYLFHFMLKELYLSVGRSLNDMHSWLGEIKKNSCIGFEEKMVLSISELNHVMNDYNQSFKFHNETLVSFQNIALFFFGVDFSDELVRITSEYHKIQHQLDGHIVALNDLRETNNSLLKIKTHKTIQHGIGLAYIFLPLIVVVQILSMNMFSVYIKNSMYFIAVLVGIFLFGLFMYWYTKAKQWL